MTVRSETGAIIKKNANFISLSENNTVNFFFRLYV